MLTLPEKDADAPEFLRALFDQAVASANPENCIPQHLPEPPKGRTLLVAAGKAAASMARAVEKNWPADKPLSGTALTRYGHSIACNRIEVIEAAHPVPDNRGHEAASKLLVKVEQLGSDDLLLFLVSGGGSALLALPAPGISLEEKKSINKSLLMSGAPIGEMNTVRKHLSAIKGGRLAAATAPARIVTLAISDVPHDDPSTIASGPSVPDTTTSADAIELLERYNIALPASIRSHLESPASATPKPGNPVFQNTKFVMVATPSMMLESVVQDCRESDINVTTLGADIEGESRNVAEEHAELAINQAQGGKRGLILSGGETTVTVDGPAGRGGRNCEYLLALAIALNEAQGIHAIAADTDGIDGSEDNAGAIIRPDTLSRARDLGLDANAYLEAHDSYSFFERLDDLIMTGPTRTNVNDFRAIWVSQRSATTSDSSGHHQ